MGNPVMVSAIGNMIKTIFEPSINNTVEKEVAFLRQLAWTNKHRIPGSRVVEHSIGLVNNTSSGWRAGSADTLPTGAGMPKVAASDVQKATSYLRSLFAYMEFLGDTLEFTANDVGAFAEIFKWEAMSLADQTRIGCNRSAYGDGTGELGEVVEANPTNQITVRTSSTIAHSPNKNWFEKGMHLDFYNPTNFYAGSVSNGISTGSAVKRNDQTSYKIASVVKGSTQVVLNLVKDDGSAADLQADHSGSGSDVVAGDKIVIEGSYFKEPYGTKAIIDNGSYTSSFLGISEATYDRWNAYVEDGGFVAWDEIRMQNIIDHLEDHDALNEATVLYMDTDTRNAVVRLVKSTMLSPLSEDLKGGFKTISYGGKKLYRDRLAPYGTIWAVDMRTIIPHQMSATKDNIFGAFKFDDKGGGVLHRSKNEDLFYCVGTCHMNFTTNQRNTNAVYRNINPAA